VLDPILVSGNGWVYKPDELRTEHEIRKNLNKTFDRSNGAYEARSYLQSKTEEHFSDRNWEKPIFADDPKQPSRGHYDSLSVAWLDSVWGWVTSSIRIQQDKGLVTYSIDMHELAGWMMGKKANSRHRFLIEVGKKDIPRAVNEWVQDPWNVPTNLMDYGDRWDEVFDTPPLFTDLTFKDEEEWYQPDSPLKVVSLAAGNGLYYRKGVIEKVFASQHNWEQLNELFSALEFVGFTVRPRWSYLNYTEKYLTGITIDIPEQKGMHEHSIIMHANNPHVVIKCGYQHDDERWLDRKQREAVEQMADLERDLEVVSYEIEL